MEKSTTLKKSLFYSILIFNFYIPLFLIASLFSNTKQLIVEGEISRGGISQTCQSADYDPRGGGGYVCENGADYSSEPIRFISFGEATIEDLFMPLKLFPITLLMGVGFGFYYNKNNKNKN